MRNKDTWIPSKFVFRKNRLVASRDVKQVAVSSRLIADLVANLYQVFIPKYVRGKLLDLGCGKVPLYQAYRAYISDNICVDWQNSMHENAHIDYECDLTKTLPFGDCEFDTILLSDVLEHIPNPEALFYEMSRILKPAGRILLNVPFFYRLHEEPHDYYRYTEYALRRFARLANMQVLHLICIGGSPEIAADMFAKHVRIVPLIGGGVAKIVQSGTAAFVKTAIGRRISQRSSKGFPLGYFLVLERPAGSVQS
jgi:SAM-dependent methyltransferase